MNGENPKVDHMKLPTLKVIGIEKIDGFKKVTLISCEDFRLSFEIFGSKSFIRSAQAQLLLGSVTANFDEKDVRLKVVECITSSDPERATISSEFRHLV